MTDHRPDPLVYLITPPLADAAGFIPLLDSVLGETDVACVLLDFDPRSLTDAKKIARELAPLAQSRGTALLVRDPVLAARVGADGAHVSEDGDDFADALARATESLKPERIVGAGRVRTKHGAMLAGDRGVDYVMFGDPSPDGSTPALEQVLDRVAWWAEIFTPPCVAYAAILDDAGALAAAGADFIAFGASLWTDPRGPRGALLETMLPLQRKGTRAP